MKLKYIATLLYALIMTSCAGELTKQDALEMIASQSELTEKLYAPLHLAPEVLTGDHQKDPKSYIARKYGKLIDAGLINVSLGNSNSWRTILKTSLTEKGTQMENAARTVDDMFYVEVCRVVADSIISLDLLGQDTIVCRYQLKQTEITPFGEYLGFSDGRTHRHERKFIKGTFSWSLLPIE